MNKIFHFEKKATNTFAPWFVCSHHPICCQTCMAPPTANAHCGYLKEIMPRAISSERHWGKPLGWNRQVSRGGTRLVEVGSSYCDWADEKAPEGQRERLWELIRKTPNLQWNLTTKRAANIGQSLPVDWEDGYENVSLGVVVEDHEVCIERVAILRQIPAQSRHVKVGPLQQEFGKINLRGIDRVDVVPLRIAGFGSAERELAVDIHRQCFEQGFLVSKFYLNRLICDRLSIVVFADDADDEQRDQDEDDEDLIVEENYD